MLSRLLYGKWEYLGYLQLYSKDDTGKFSIPQNIVHFYARIKNQKKRKIRYSDHRNEYHIYTAGWYNKLIVPWLEGGDLWKPIEHPVAVRGTLINHMTKTP